MSGFFFFGERDDVGSKFPGLEGKIEFITKHGNEYYLAHWDVGEFRRRLDEQQKRFPIPRIKERTEKPRLAMLTPVRPIRSGISDYSEKQIAYLKEQYDITVFIDALHPTNERLFAEVEWYHLADFARWRELGNEDVPVLYVLGNHDCHSNIFQWSRKVAGIVEIHDAIPVAYGMHAGNFWMNRIEWRELVTQEYGCSIEQLAQQKYEEGYTFDLLPMIKTFTANHHGVIVHNEWCAELVRKSHPEIPVINTGLGISPEELPDISNAKRT